MDNAALARRGERTLEIAGCAYSMHSVLEVPGAERLPLSLKILLENVLRCVSDEGAARAMTDEIVRAGSACETGGEIEFMPARVLFQDFTGVPVFVDFAAMRDAAAARGADPFSHQPPDSVHARGRSFGRRRCRLLLRGGAPERPDRGEAQRRALLVPQMERVQLR